MLNKKKYNPYHEQPDDTVGTIYCKENTEEYDNILKNDMLPYISPLPQQRRTPEPPII